MRLFVSYGTLSVLQEEFSRPGSKGLNKKNLKKNEKKSWGLHRQAA